MSLGRVGLIGRWKPLHNGGAILLDYACRLAEEVIIGIGSSNSDGSVQKYNARNPFTPEETKGMIDAYLSPRHANYRTLFIPDYGHMPGNSDGMRWKEHAISAFGPLDHFITGNAYVAKLLQKEYDIIPPWTIIPKEEQFPLRATEVRIAIAKGDAWKNLVPKEVAAYILHHKLDERLRREFGLETLLHLMGTAYDKEENGQQEQEHTYER
jgi:nicotinamide mononucleotide adenylyltransferase